MERQPWWELWVERRQRGALSLIDAEVVVVKVSSAWSGRSISCARGCTWAVRRPSWRRTPAPAQ
eukprot:9534905-Alexandrium_andersonii.AAC.1